MSKRIFYDGENLLFVHSKPCAHIYFYFRFTLLFSSCFCPLLSKLACPALLRNGLWTVEMCATHQRMGKGMEFLLPVSSSPIGNDDNEGDFDFLLNCPLQRELRVSDLTFSRLEPGPGRRVFGGTKLTFSHTCETQMQVGSFICVKYIRSNCVSTFPSNHFRRTGRTTLMTWPSHF